MEKINIKNKSTEKKVDIPVKHNTHDIDLANKKEKNYKIIAICIL
jgi:predicted ATP-dependent protease